MNAQLNQLQKAPHAAGLFFVPTPSFRRGKSTEQGAGRGSSGQNGYSSEKKSITSYIYDVLSTILTKMSKIMPFTSLTPRASTLVGTLILIGSSIGSSLLGQTSCTSVTFDGYTYRSENWRPVLVLEQPENHSICRWDFYPRNHRHKRMVQYFGGAAIPT